MRNTKFLLGLLASVHVWLLSPVAGLSQDPAFSKNDTEFSLMGEVRPRAEFRNGFKRLRDRGEDAAFFVEQRSRLYFDYRRDNLRFRFVLQDVRTWGNTDQIFKSDPALQNIREAWGEYSLGSKVSFKLGRQSIYYDNERFLGALEWAQQGRAHDALLVKFKGDSNRSELHVGLAFNQNVLNEPAKLSDTFYAGINNYKTIQYLWYHRTFQKGKFSLLGLNDGRQNVLDSAVNFLYTIGSYGQFSFAPGIIATAEYYYQGGDNMSGQRVNGYLGALSVSFLEREHLELTAGCDYLSGTGMHDPRNTSFDPTFGTNHSFYGSMDYFYGGNTHGQNGWVSGLVDIYFKVSCNVSSESTLKADVHHFSSAAAIYDPEQPMERLGGYLATEVDLAFIAKLSHDVTLQAGYSQMFGSAGLEAVKGMKGDRSVTNNWAWIMLTIKPLLINRKTE